MSSNKNYVVVSLWLLILAVMPFAVANAQVKVTAADPSAAPQGTVSLDVTVSGSGFDSSAKVKFLVSGSADAGGVWVKNVNVLNSRKLVATIDVAGTATISQFDIEVQLSSGRKGKGTTLFAVTSKPNGEANNCANAEASFVFSQRVPGTPRRDFYLASTTGSCQKFLFAVGAGNYDRYASFRILNGEGRVVTTNGMEDLVFARFTIGVDMAVGVVSTRSVFRPENPGFIDNAFELAADGKRLAYITVDEDGGTTWLTRLRVLSDIDACDGCDYDEGMLLAERVGISDILAWPRWSSDGSLLWLEDRRGDFYRPYLSTVPTTAPSSGLHLPQIVIDGGSAELGLLGLRARGTGEVLAYTSKAGSGCREVMVVDTAACASGSCVRVNSTTPRVLTLRSSGSIQSADASSLGLLVEGAKESKNGSCSLTGKIIRALDTSSTVQFSEVATGYWPAAK